MPMTAIAMAFPWRFSPLLANYRPMPTRPVSIDGSRPLVPGASVRFGIAQITCPGNGYLTSPTQNKEHPNRRRCDGGVDHR
jgi:hypothetical protein